MIIFHATHLLRESNHPVFHSMTVLTNLRILPLLLQSHPLVHFTLQLLLQKLERHKSQIAKHKNFLRKQLNSLPTSGSTSTRWRMLSNDKLTFSKSSPSIDVPGMLRLILCTSVGPLIIESPVVLRDLTSLEKSKSAHS